MNKAYLTPYINLLNMFSELAIIIPCYFSKNHSFLQDRDVCKSE